MVLRSLLTHNKVYVIFNARGCIDKQFEDLEMAYYAISTFWKYYKFLIKNNYYS